MKKSSPVKRQPRSFNCRLGKHLHLTQPCQHEQQKGVSSLRRAGCTLADEFTARREQSWKVQSGKSLYSPSLPAHKLRSSARGMESWSCPLQGALLESHLQLLRSRAAARSTCTRLLTSMVNRSRTELNYRAGIVPSGFGCQWQPWRRRAAPRDRRSSTVPAASAASACATRRACGQRHPGWGSVMTCRASARKHENPKH